MSTRTAWGHGLVTVVTTGPAQGAVLDARFPEPHLGLPPDRRTPDGTAVALEALAADDDARGVRTEVRTVVVDLDVPPADTTDAYLRLHLLSTRLVAPHGLALDGVFGVLPTVVWTDRGPCAQEDFEATRLRIRAVTGAFPVVHAVDKFPRMLDYVLPSGVRVADGARVRLGAHLAEGTTVMHEGFVNFNAGTLGASMVEGRVSAGVVVGDGSDIGGGASIMGTLSGGGRETITVGRRSLLGANAGLGIPLGDDCVVEAGLYLTAGTKVMLDETLTRLLHEEGVLRADGEGRRAVPARALAGRAGVLFRRHSLTGQVEALARDGVGVTLNPDLHA